VLAEVAACSAEPPLLPFGRGWRRGGSTESLAQQIVDFTNWARRHDSSDFIKADAAVRTTFGVGAKWRARDRARVRERLLERELGLERDDVHTGAGDLPSGWHAVDAQLSAAAKLIARTGVRSHGTFTRRVARLVDELGDLVDRTDVEQLMSEWLAKPMVDEGIAAAPSLARTKVLREVDWRYRPTRGVPLRFWAMIEQRVREQWTKSPLDGGPAPLTLDALLLSAFFVSAKFYKARTPILGIHYDAFEHVTKSNTARTTRLFLTSAGIISVVKEYREGSHSRTYGLAADLWPPRDSEVRVFRPSSPPADLRDPSSSEPHPSTTTARP
jgi:hypothetical protein